MGRQGGGMEIGFILAIEFVFFLSLPSLFVILHPHFYIL